MSASDFLEFHDMRLHVCVRLFDRHLGDQLQPMPGQFLLSALNPVFSVVVILVGNGDLFLAQSFHGVADKGAELPCNREDRPRRDISEAE